MEIVPLNLPPADLKLTRKDKGVHIWCIVRKKDLLCTPEEWVRQHIIHYLINEKNVPVGLIASEYALEYNGLSKRADIVVFDRSGKPQLLVECKAPEVKISENTFYQMAQYQSQLSVPYFVLTNGLDHFVGRINDEDGTVILQSDIPENLIIEEPPA